MRVRVPAGAELGEDFGDGRKHVDAGALQPAFRFGVVGVVDEGALIGGDRLVELAALFHEPRVAEVELDIGRIIDDLRVEGGKIVRRGECRRRDQDERRQGE